jgi:hypothetical protein
MIQLFPFSSWPWPVAILQDRPQCFDESRASGHQFIAVMQHQLTQNLLSAHSKCQQDLASILLSPLAANKSTALEPIYKFDGTMMLNLEAIGDLCNAGTNPWSQAFEGQQQLVLSGLKARIAHHTLAEAKITAYLMAELGQRLVVHSG